LMLFLRVRLEVSNEGEQHRSIPLVEGGNSRKPQSKSVS
jgi:hypothetical protein